MAEQECNLDCPVVEVRSESKVPDIGRPSTLEVDRLPDPADWPVPILFSVWNIREEGFFKPIESVGADVDDANNDFVGIVEPGDFVHFERKRQVATFVLADSVSV